MNKKIVINGMCVAFVVVIFLYISISNDDVKKVITNNKFNQVINSNVLTMMYETEADSGEYQVANDNSWPQEGYVFNETLSKCENGSKLTWDDENKKVVMQANNSDKCYVYFDIEPTLADLCSGKAFSECITTHIYTGIDGENDLYYHDGNGSYTNADQEAGDNSYRYSGANPNNYVCFGIKAETCPEDSLYRIIGVFDGQVKLIKLTSIGNYVWDEDDVNFSSIINTSNQDNNYNVMQLGDVLAAPDIFSGSNIWAKADLNYYINNDYFFNTLTSDWQNKISTKIWYVGGGSSTQIMYGANSTAKNAFNYEQGSNRDGTTYEAKVGLMYVNEYYYGATPAYWNYPGYTYSNYPDANGNYGAEYDYRAAVNDNWIYLGIQEWTISRKSDDNFNSNAIIIESAGSVSSSPINSIVYNGINGEHSVRPTFYLNPNVEFNGGSGTSADPYKLS